MLAPLKVRMSARNNAFTQKLADGKELSFANDAAREAALEGNGHPLVRTHPVTGEKALYLDEVYAVGIDGLTSAEARPLLEFLIQHITQHHFTCRLRWDEGMVAMWDNRTALHLAANDYDGYRREMYRTTLAGRDATLTGNLNNVFNRRYWNLNMLGEARNASLDLRIDW